MRKRYSEREPKPPDEFAMRQRETRVRLEEAAGGFASLTGLQDKLALPAERLYFLRAASDARAAIVHDYE